MLLNIQERGVKSRNSVETPQNDPMNLLQQSSTTQPDIARGQTITCVETDERQTASMRDKQASIPESWNGMRPEIERIGTTSPATKPTTETARRDAESDKQVDLAANSSPDLELIDCSPEATNLKVVTAEEKHRVTAPETESLSPRDMPNTKSPVVLHLGKSSKRIQRRKRKDAKKAGRKQSDPMKPECSSLGRNGGYIRDLCGEEDGSAFRRRRWSYEVLAWDDAIYDQRAVISVEDVAQENKEPRLGEEEKWQMALAMRKSREEETFRKMQVFGLPDILNDVFLEILDDHDDELNEEN